MNRPHLGGGVDHPILSDILETLGLVAIAVFVVAIWLGFFFGVIALVWWLT